MAHSQRQVAAALESYNKGDTLESIHQSTGVSLRTLRRWIRAAGHQAKPGIEAQRAALKQDPYGYSTLYGAEGEVKLQWVKTDKGKQEVREIVEEIIEGMEAQIPQIGKIKLPKVSRAAKDRMNVHVFGDSHVNMLSWHPETQQSWDMDIALERHITAMKDLIDRSPDAEVGVLATMGDLLHADSLKPFTASGTNVDVDGRLGKGWDCVIIMLRAMIEMMLKKYKRVVLVILRGNHCETLELVLCKSMTMLYEKEPRLEVLDNTCRHIPLVWESNFLCFTHGDRLNDQKKADIAVSMFRKEHGNAKFTHVLTGHVHHASQKEVSGTLVETFPALPSPDAWHVESGFVTSDKSASVLSYHAGGGITERTISFPRIDMNEYT